MPSKETFIDKTFEALRQSAHDIAAAVPEVEAVMSVVLWRLPGHANVPCAIIVGADGPIMHPDQFLRALQASTVLQKHLVEQSSEAVVLLRDLASRTAGEINGRKEPQGSGPAPQQQGQTSHGSPDDDRPGPDPRAG